MDAVEFQQELRYLADEIYSATLSWHSYLTVNTEINANERLLDALNLYPSFWKITFHSLQQNTLLVLGRIFDKNNRSRSIQSIVRVCIEHPEFFSKEALKTRRITEDASVEKAEWLNDWLNKAFIPKSDDFGELNVLVQGCITTWSSAYAALRNKLVAHRDKLTKEGAAEIYAKTRVAEITELLQRLHSIEQALVELCMNGRALSFPQRTNPRVAEAEQATKGVLRLIMEHANG